MTAPVSAKRTALRAAARERILILDGAWGVMIQAPRLTRRIFAASGSRIHATCRRATTILLS